MKKHYKKFNPKALTPFFKTKVELVRNIIDNWEAIDYHKQPGGYEQSGTFKDKKRNVYVYVYLGLKCIGIGRGRPNQCSIRWSLKFHPEHNGKALSKKEIELYVSEIRK